MEFDVLGGVLRRREGGGLFMDFLCIIDYSIGWGFLSWGFFSTFLFLSFREGRFVSSYFISCFLPFSFLSLLLFCLFSFPDENHQRLESGAIPSNHWAGSAKAMIVLRIAATFVVPLRSCSFVENWPFTISRARVRKSL